MKKILIESLFNAFATKALKLRALCVLRGYNILEICPMTAESRLQT